MINPGSGDGCRMRKETSKGGRAVFERFLASMHVPPTMAN